MLMQALYAFFLGFQAVSQPNDLDARIFLLGNLETSQQIKRETLEV